MSDSADSSDQFTLTIIGRAAPSRLEIVLSDGIPQRFGRSPRRGVAIPWDTAISREHGDLCVRNGTLEVECLENARNSIFHRENEVRTAAINHGESFQIGSTQFHFAGTSSSQANGETTLTTADPDPVANEHTFTGDDLRTITFRNSEHQLEILATLPELISRTQSDFELQATICDLLMDALPKARAVAVIQFDADQIPASDAALTEFPDPINIQIRTRDVDENEFPRKARNRG